MPISILKEKQLTSNLGVPGSSPGGRASKSSTYQEMVVPLRSYGNVCGNIEHWFRTLNGFPKTAFQPSRTTAHPTVSTYYFRQPELSSPHGVRVLQKIAPSMLAWDRLAVERSASVKFAPLRSAIRKSASSKLAPSKLALRICA